MPHLHNLDPGLGAAMISYDKTVIRVWRGEEARVKINLEVLLGGEMSGDAE